VVVGLGWDLEGFVCGSFELVYYAFFDEGCCVGV